MNVERVSLADIDTDWLSEDREVVKEYLYHKKGLHCCDIVTFNTIALKGAIRDIGRALDMPLDEVTEICNESDDEEELKKLRKKYKKLFRYVDMVNGVIVSVGNHPAGIVVSPFPVEPWFGTFTTATDQYPISVLNMKEIDSLNFVKLDVLGLDNIGLIYKTCDAAGISFLTPDNTPSDDIDVWNSIRDDTTMIFQWESSTASAYLKKLFSDSTIMKIQRVNPNFSRMDLLSIGNGAIRPAGESYRDKLAEGIFQDNGHEALNEFLAPTLGYLVYQEQIIDFLHKFCGFTMGEADVVRRCFAKKYGTEDVIPIIKNGGYLNDGDHYIAGFIKTMQQDYGVKEEEGEKLIVSFLRVIEDASDYLFSKNHADPYSWIGYICGYLRYYYPLEFITSALNVFKDKEKKTLSIIDYAKRNGIKISPIKFRHSTAEYSFDRETNQIFKGIASIKFMNVNIADEMYALRNNHYENFMELMYDLRGKTSLNSRQMKILIDLDFFSEFGDANKLLQQFELYENFAGRRQIRKSETGKLGISEEEARQFSGRETEKMFADIDTKSLLIYAADKVKYHSRTLADTVKAQQEHLGYLDIADDRYRGMFAVLEVNRKYSPRVKMHSLKNGKNYDFKVNKQLFNQNKIKEGDIIRVEKWNYKERTKRTDEGKFIIIPGEMDMWLLKYSKA